MAAKKRAFSGRKQWREWLESHHDSADHLWLTIQKRNSNKRGLVLEDAVEEALCFGWIDGTLRTLDGNQYLLRFSPRRKHSIWSIHNIRRAKRLIRDGLMTEAGLEKINEATENGEWEKTTLCEQVDVLPAMLERALRRKRGALAAFRELPVSRKKQLLWWFHSAKTEATRKKRVESIVEKV